MNPRLRVDAEIRKRGAAGLGPAILIGVAGNRRSPFLPYLGAGFGWDFDWTFSESNTRFSNTYRVPLVFGAKVAVRDDFAVVMELAGSHHKEDRGYFTGQLPVATTEMVFAIGLTWLLN